MIGGLRFAVARALAARVPLTATAAVAALSSATAIVVFAAAASVPEVSVSSGVGSITGIALAMVAVVVLLAVAATGADAARQRRAESTLLSARGARPGQLSLLACGEALVVSGLAATVGAVVTVPLVSAVFAVVPSIGATFGSVVVVTVIAGAVAGVGAVARTAPGGRIRLAATVTALVLVAAFAGLAGWRLVSGGVDPVSVFAPALLLFVGAFGAVVLSVPVGAGAARAFARGRGVVAVTAWRQLARRPDRNAVSMILVALAVGITTVATALSGSLVSLGAGPEQLRVGADIRVVTIPADVTASEIAEVSGVSAAMTARQLVALLPTATGAGERVPVLAVEATQLGEVMAPVAGIVNPPEWQRVLASDTTTGAVPALVTEDVAAALRLRVGDELSLDASSPNLVADIEIAGVIPVLPGVPGARGVLVDASRLKESSGVPLTPNQLWLSTDVPADAVARIDAAFGSVVVLVADPDAVDQLQATARVVGAAALGATTMAITVLALRRVRPRHEVREFALLAVLGSGRRSASRVAAVEDLSAVALGVVGGLIAGVVTAIVSVPVLARDAAGDLPAAYPVPLRLDPLSLAVAVGLIVVVAVVLAATARIPRQWGALVREDE